MGNRRISSSQNFLLVLKICALIIIIDRTTAANMNYTAYCYYYFVTLIIIAVTRNEKARGKNCAKDPIA
jgi:hypothetical protein